MIMKHSNRREFLKSVAMTSAIAAFPSLLFAGEEKIPITKAWQPKPALSSVMFSHLSLEDFCVQAAKLGFKGIDLWGPFGPCTHLLEAEKLGADGFNKLLKKHKLELAVWTTYQSKQNEQGFPAFAEFIGSCGGGVVVRGSTYVSPSKEKLDGAMRLFFEELKPEIELARKHKVKLAIENHAFTILDGLDSFESFTRLNPAPDVVGVAIAPYHLQRCKASVVDVIKASGKQLLFFYAWQLGEGTKQFPGQGPVDFAPWLSALKEQQYQHWMTPFMHGELSNEEMSPLAEKARIHLLSLGS